MMGRVPDDASVAIDFTLSSICAGIGAVLDAIGVVLIVTALSFAIARGCASPNIGPRIFAVNLLLFDLAYCVASFLINFMLAALQLPIIVGYTKFLRRIGLKLDHADMVRSLALLVFNVSFVPMLVMFIVACVRPQQHSSISVAWRFATLVLATDLVAGAIELGNVCSMDYVMNTWATLSFGIACFTLLTVQAVVVFIAVWVIRQRTKALVHLQRRQAAARRGELKRLLYFAIGPSLAQLPFAVYILIFQLETHNPRPTLFTQTVFYYSFMVMRPLFSLKPVVDALSVMLFLGDFRRDIASSVGSIRRWLHGLFCRGAKPADDALQAAPVAAVASSIIGVSPHTFSEMRSRQLTPVSA